MHDDLRPVSPDHFLFPVAWIGRFSPVCFDPAHALDALSTGLWFAVFGVCCVALIMLAGFGFVAGAFAMKAENIQPINAPVLLSTLGWGYVMVGALITIVLATCAAWLHQKLVHRFTFALFRLYATAVCAGIGSIFGWLLSVCISARGFTPLGIAISASAMMILIIAFGTVAYRGARGLRGKAPSRFTWISPEEFTGSDS